MSELEKLDLRRPRPRLRLALLVLLLVIAVFVVRAALRWGAEERARDQIRASLPDLRAAVARLEACVLGGDHPIEQWPERLAWRALSIADPGAQLGECTTTARTELTAALPAIRTEAMEALAQSTADLARLVATPTDEPLSLAAALCRRMERMRGQLLDLERAGGEHSGQDQVASVCAELGTEPGAGRDLPAVTEPAGLRAQERTGHRLRRGQLVAEYEHALARFTGDTWEHLDLPARSARAIWPGDRAFAVTLGTPQKLWTYRDLTWQHLADLPDDLVVRGMDMATTGLILVADSPDTGRWFALRSSEDLTTLRAPIPLTPVTPATPARRGPARCWHAVTPGGALTLACARDRDPRVRVHHLPAGGRQVRRRTLGTRESPQAAAVPTGIDLCAAGDHVWLSPHRGELFVSRDRGARWRRHQAPELEPGLSRCRDDRWQWVGRLPDDPGLHRVVCTASAGCQGPRRVGNQHARAAIPSVNGRALLIFARGGGALLLETDEHGELVPTEVFSQARLGDDRAIPAWSPGDHLFVERPSAAY